MPKSVVRVMIGRCGNLTLAGRQYYPYNCEVNCRERARQGTRVMARCVFARCDNLLSNVTGCPPVYTYALKMMALHQVKPSHPCLHWFPSILTPGMLTATSQAPKSHLRPAELVVKRYERLILQGALLTPDGWKLAWRLFTKTE